MTDPREAVVRRWFDAEHRETEWDEDECNSLRCTRPWSEHAAMLLAAIDAADPDKATP